MVSVNYQTYKNLVKQNWVDGKIDDSKVAMLSNLRKTLGVTDEEHEQILGELGGGSAPAPAAAAPETPTPAAPETPAPASDATQEPTEPPLALPEQGTPDSGRYLRDTDFATEGYASEPEAYSPAEKQENDAAPTVADTGIKRVSPAPAEQPTAPSAPTPASSASADVSGEESPDKLLETGKDAYRKGEYKKAFEICDKVLQMKPNHSQALFFKKRAKSKIDEGGGEAEAAPEEAADPMMAHTQTAVSPAQPAAGSANPKCLSCRDTEVCSWCKASGVCWMCHGGGKCSACKGTGIVEGDTCNKCKGSGQCDSCLGSGKCYWCKGSGKCHKCQK